LFLLPERNPEIFVPRRFAEPGTGPDNLAAELVRLHLSIAAGLLTAAVPADLSHCRLLK
jgi:hypothetical protein